MEISTDGKVGLGTTEPNKLLFVNGNIGIGTTSPAHQIDIKCTCGNESSVDTDFEINIIGMLQFKCKKCGKIINAPDCLLK